jgi:hypothetical protein
MQSVFCGRLVQMHIESDHEVREVEVREFKERRKWVVQTNGNRGGVYAVHKDESSKAITKSTRQ